MTHGWAYIVTTARGSSNIATTVGRVPHRAAWLLGHLRQRGATVPVTTPAWPVERRDGAVKRVSHRSSEGERQFVSEEMLNFCAQGYWVVVPYRTVRHMRHLRISPLGVVPKRDRRPRLIVDHTFSGLNEETLQLALREAMQFGRELQRVCSTLVHADPSYRPVCMAKINIADGFYRVWVRVEDIPILGVVLPCSIPGHEPLIAFPLALPMGWVESPPYFSALTETACNLANQLLRTGDRRLWEPHRLEVVASKAPADYATARPTATTRATIGATSHPRKPVAEVDVYVDDFLLLAQTHRQPRQRVLRAALHSIDSVFRLMEEGDPPHRKEPASVKKFLKGDACWMTRKRILGWDIDAQSMTLHRSTTASD